MANIFGILAALVLAFAAFVAHKNKEQLTEQLARIDTEDQKLTRQTSRYNELGKSIVELKKDKTDADTTREVKQVELNKQLAANKDLKSTTEAKNAEAEDAEKRVAEAKDQLKDIGDLPELAGKINQLKSTIRGLEDDVALVNAQVTKLNGQKSNTKEQAAKLAEIQSFRTTGKSLPGLKTRVTSVFRNYGFVTLAGGDNAGVVNGSKLQVLRNGEEVAQLVVTAVEANSASANIIPSSLKEDDQVTIGDKVVPLSPKAAKKK